MRISSPNRPRINGFRSPIRPQIQPHPRLMMRKSEVQVISLTDLQGRFRECSAKYEALQTLVASLKTDHKKDKGNTDLGQKFIAANAALIAAKREWTPLREAYNCCRMNTARTSTEMANLVKRLDQLASTIEATLK